MTNSYQFITRWRFEATAAQVFGLISKPQEFPRWWGSVYLKAEQIAPGDEKGAGRVVRFVTKGFLPYRLRWDSQTVDVVRPLRIVVRAAGDFAGEGVWTFEEQGAFTNVIFDWRVDAEKPLLKNLSWLFKPLFKANHRWAMEQGRQGLVRELARLEKSG